MRAMMTHMTNFFLADSLLGIQAQSSFDDGYQVRHILKSLCGKAKCAQFPKIFNFL